MTKNLINLLASQKVCPIIRNADAQKVNNIADALIDGGIKILEINVENSNIFETISKISQKAYVCAGGIITTTQAKAAIDSGAQLLSSPIFSMNIVKLSKDRHVPLITGATTANEAYTAWKARVPLIKLYPATALGGTKYVKDMLRPMSFLNILPQGNIKLSEVQSYIEAGAFAVGVGRDFYEGYSDNEITKRAMNFINQLKG